MINIYRQLRAIWGERIEFLPRSTGGMEVEITHPDGEHTFIYTEDPRTSFVLDYMVRKQAFKREIGA